MAMADHQGDHSKLIATMITHYDWIFTESNDAPVPPQVQGGHDAEMGGGDTMTQSFNKSVWRGGLEGFRWTFVCQGVETGNGFVYMDTKS